MTCRSLRSPQRHPVMRGHSRDSARPVWTSVSIVAISLATSCRPEGSTVPKSIGAPPTGMVLVPAGRFQPGGEMSQNPFITVTSLFIDETEVTVSAYAACVQAGRCDALSVNAVPGQGSQLVASAECNYGARGRENHPMNCVDWNQANAYCRARGKRLPTNDEWEWWPEARQSPSTCRSRVRGDRPGSRRRALFSLAGRARSDGQERALWEVTRPVILRSGPGTCPATCPSGRPPINRVRARRIALR
jgi:formylglycine-generating enzyme required for sulfatase activity